jgi:hypothetical protein
LRYRGTGVSLHEIEQLEKTIEIHDILLPFGTESLQGIMRKHAGTNFLTIFNCNLAESPCPVDIDEIAVTGTGHLAVISKSTQPT